MSDDLCGSKFDSLAQEKNDDFDPPPAKKLKAGHADANPSIGGSPICENNSSIDSPNSSVELEAILNEAEDTFVLEVSSLSDMGSLGEQQSGGSETPPTDEGGDIIVVGVTENIESLKRVSAFYSECT